MIKNIFVVIRSERDAQVSKKDLGNLQQIFRLSTFIKGICEGILSMNSPKAHVYTSGKLNTVKYCGIQPGKITYK